MFHIYNVLERIKSNKTIRNGGLYSVYSFIGRGASFILLILLAKYIQPAEYGQLSLFNTVVMLLGYFMGFSSFGYISVSYFKNSKQDFKKDFTVIITLYLFTTAFFILILMVFEDYLSNILHLSPILLWYAIIISLFNIFFYINQDLARIREKVGTYGILSCSSALLNFVLSLILVIGFKQSWMGRINAQLLCTLFYGFVAIVFFLKYHLFDFHLSWDRYKVIFLWCLPIIPHLTTNWLRQGCDRYIIDYNYSVYEVGLFSFALNLIAIFTMIGFAFNSTNSVSLYKLLSNKEGYTDVTARISKLTRMMFYIYTIACVVLTLILPVIVYVFLPKYVPSLQYFYLLSVFGYLECIYYIYINYLFYYGKTQQIMYITFGTSVVHLLLSLVLTRFSLYYTAFIYIVVDLIQIILLYKISSSLKRQHNIV